MPQCEAAGRTYFVQDLNPAAGRAVVFVHGLFANHTVFLGCGVEELAAWRRAILFDLPGHGLTPPSLDGDYRLASLAGGLIALLDSLGVGQADLVGHSFGAAVGLEAALLAPGRIGRIVLIEAYGLLSSGLSASRRRSPAGPTELAALTSPAGPSGPPGAGRATLDFDSPIVWRRLGFRSASPADRQRAKALTADGRLAASLDQDKGFFASAPLDRVSQPALLLNGFWSPYLRDARLAARRLPDARLRLAWGGHDLPLRRASWVRRRLAAFLGPDRPAVAAGSPADAGFKAVGR
ncbi:MAG: alpha/beta fold hydrolase [Propionibacteriaceae bacterium]|jgi:pimeloyl-ACP methyl ester carboxylesterase|nr:alpha/beta fold hydrolase [Propionibacteriaceae bacterium]